MNDNHARLCPSPEWAAYLHAEVLPEVVDGIDLGQEMREVGTGPGAATDWLRHRVARLVAVESHRPTAEALVAKYAGSNLEIVFGDATDLAFDGQSFDSVGCFTMLHHVRTVTLQDRLLGEVLRVLRPGGVLVGSDSPPSPDLERFHDGDVYNPVEPATFAERLQRLGFDQVTVKADRKLTFTAHKLGSEQA